MCDNDIQAVPLDLSSLSDKDKLEYLVVKNQLDEQLRKKTFMINSIFFIIMFVWLVGCIIYNEKKTQAALDKYTNEVAHVEEN